MVYTLAIQKSTNFASGVINNGGSSSESPFKDVGTKTAASNAVDDQTLRDLAEGLERLIDVAKNEKDVVELLKKLLHPAELAKMMERDPSLEEFKRRFNESNRFEMLEGLLSIDVRRPRCRKA